MAATLVAVPAINSCATGRPAPAVALPNQHAILEKREVAGLENFIQVTERIYSGSEPHDEGDFAALAALGVTTIVSSDGKLPDVAAAARHGIKYVHVPVGYDGVPDKAAAQAIRATREAKGAVYFHCHHGRHRGPALAAAALQSETSCDVATVNEFLALARTSPEYKGLWRDALSYDIPRLTKMRVQLPEQVQPDNLHDAMHHIDRSFDRLMAARDHGWKTPPKHPDVDPSHEAILLAQVFRELGRTETKHMQEDFRAWLKVSDEESLLLSKSIKAGDLEGATGHFKKIESTCWDCHRQYRD